MPMRRAYADSPIVVASQQLRIPGIGKSHQVRRALARDPREHPNQIGSFHVPIRINASRMGNAEILITPLNGVYITPLNGVYITPLNGVYIAMMMKTAADT